MVVLLYRLPLYEGVDWYMQEIQIISPLAGLPLYEGVDWNFWLDAPLLRASVSLFTREWIEISRIALMLALVSVSLFTREWIEIVFTPADRAGIPPSPSLRGSGLKSPTLEEIRLFAGLPLYEGVDWNCMIHSISMRCDCLPLYEGVDWNNFSFTRSNVACESLPLYEGVDWNCTNRSITCLSFPSPSLRGSGLKWLSGDVSRCRTQSPSLRGSGLKSLLPSLRITGSPVSLFTREWIEIQNRSETLLIY